MPIKTKTISLRSKGSLNKKIINRSSGSEIKHDRHGDRSFLLRDLKRFGYRADLGDFVVSFNVEDLWSDIKLGFGWDHVCGVLSEGVLINRDNYVIGIFCKFITETEININVAIAKIAFKLRWVHLKILGIVLLILDRVGLSS